MDPNKTLQAFREARDEAWAAPDGSPERLHALEAAVEAADSLDQWLTGGGFTPTAWQAG